MRGDFSAWNKDRAHNFRGALHQQGRVLLDRDWNAQTEIMGEWQETAARDAFGAGVAAVPADEPSGFKVTKAEITGGAVSVSLTRGRVWADGLLTELARDQEPPALPAGVDAIRRATYLGAPIQPAPAENAVPAVGDRDAVILETWLEEVSAFQLPQLLLEPALGGVDTTERIQTAFRLRLYRMAAGDTCESIIPKLKDDFGSKGKLRVELKPTVAIVTDCPVVDAGGFTGFEHRLYRIEIAATDRPSPEAYFKWSQFNGGLVGTGDFNAVSRKVTIRGNRNAILYSGVTGFYLEALDFDPALGYWQVVYGAKATLGADGMLTLPDPAAAPGDIFKGGIPPAPAIGQRFFRLWNGIERVDGFTAALKDLPDNLGIVVRFDAEAAGRYSPVDFWTFEVRAGGLGNPQVLIPSLPPQGIFHHRVPLAEVDWTGNVVSGADIEDCRRPFQPLTRLKGCCTYRVGDGVHSYGDFRKIQEAIAALPADGGEICILPGLYEENVVLEPVHNKHVVLKGCGRRSRVKAVTAEAAIYVKYGQGIRIESLAVEAHDAGIGILLVGAERDAQLTTVDKYLANVTLTGLFVTAVQQSAIKGYVAQHLTLSNSVIHIKETVATRQPAVYLAGDDMLVERNEIRVLPDRAVAAKRGEELTNDPDLFTAAQQAAGGLQIGGGSERVRIVNNLIVNGTGNGITLGSIDLDDGGTILTTHDPFDRKGRPIDCCNPDDGHTGDGDVDDGGRSPVAGSPLHDILIAWNRIFNMGRDGIGVATFFAMGSKVETANIALLKNTTAAGIISVSRVMISENRIERCLNAALPPIPESMSQLMGFGGIALADTEDLVIRDNYIADNGPDFLEPVCGVFVLAGQGIEISRNHVLNNGARRTVEVSAAAVKNGPRGGIFIARTRTAGVEVFPGSPGKAQFASGYPAAKIQENIVTVPFGRSLTIFASGAVSVVGNQFTSFGIPPLNLSEVIASFLDTTPGLTAGAILQLLSLLAGNVLIFDLGLAPWLPTGAAAFKNIQNGTSANHASDSAGKAGPRFFEHGAVLFSNNQCHQNLFTAGRSFAVSSIFIASLDDVAFHANQCDCDLDTDFLLVNALVFGMTARVSDNHFSESLLKVFFSAATLGLQNITTDNESVHCLLIRGMQYLSRHNLVLLEIGTVKGDVTKYDGDHLCDVFNALFPAFGGSR
jgi:hypothetical protein